MGFFRFMRKGVQTKKTFFRSGKQKGISRKKAGAFWNDFDAGKRVRKPIRDAKPRLFVAVTPSILGTVREYRTIKDLENDLRLMKEVPRTIMAKNPKHFEIKSVEVLDIDKKNKRLLERVYACPDAADFLYGLERSRFYKRFIKRLERKGIKAEEAGEIVRNSWEELERIMRTLNKEGLRFDPGMDDVLVLDINKKEKKALFAKIDVGHSIQVKYSSQVWGPFSKNPKIGIGQNG